MVFGGASILDATRDQKRNVIEHGAILTTSDTLRVPTLGDAAPVAAPPPTLADSERKLILRARAAA